MSNEEFLGICIFDMLKHGVNILFKKRIYDSKECYPYFHEDPLTFALNYFESQIKNKEWFTIFIHEYCHFIQWKNEKKKWTIDYDYASEKLNKFLDKKSKSVDIESIRKVQELELDCDKKALRLMKKHQLDVDINLYTKYSNLYILCHPLFGKYGHFYTPYELLEYVPKKHISKKDLLKDIDFELEKMYKIYLDNYLDK